MVKPLHGTKGIGIIYTGRISTEVEELVRIRVRRRLLDVLEQNVNEPQCKEYVLFSNNRRSKNVHSKNRTR